MKPQKRVFFRKSAKKQFLLTNSGVITSILGVSGVELHSSGTKPVTFFRTQSSLEGAQAVIWGGTAPECPRDVGGCAATSLQQFIEL